MKKKRIITFAAVWAVVQVLMALLVMSSAGRDNSPNLVPVVSLAGAPLGPLAGGIARFSQLDCMQFSLRILPWFLPFLAAAWLSVLIPSDTRARTVAGLALWAMGWLGWMAGAVASIGFAIG